MKNVDLRLFCLKWEKKLSKILKDNWLKEIELRIFLLKKYLVNHYQTELTIEYYDKYLKLKILISNKDDFKDLNNWFFFKTFIELFEKIIKNSKQHRCSKWLFDKLIINLINLKRRSFLKSKDNNRSSDQSKKSIIKLTNKNWLSIIHR